MPFVTGYLGKITKDLEIKVAGAKQTKLLNFTIANDEGFGDNKRTDFIPCTAFNKTAETIAKYFKKGDSIIVTGKWQNSPFRKNEKGYDIPNWQYIVNSITFLPKVKTTNNNFSQDNSLDGFTETAGLGSIDVFSQPPADDFYAINTDEPLPF